MDRVNGNESRFATVRRVVQRLGGIALVCGISALGGGCAPIAGFLVLAHGFKTVPAEFPGMKGERVVVVCQPDDIVNLAHANVAAEFEKRMGRKMRTEKIDVVHSDEVAAWLDEHPDRLDTLDQRDTMKEIAAQFEADYVVVVHLENYSLYEKHNEHLYRGRALANMQVYDVEADEQVWEKVHESIYPLERVIPVDEMRKAVFEQQFLAHLANDLGRHFYPHEPGEDVMAF